jgi:hypothetical protein
MTTATGVSYSVPANEGVARTTLITITAPDTGDSATFTVDQPGMIVMPTIVKQPEGLSVMEGDPFELNVVASGGALSYAWFHDGKPVSGAVGMSFGATMAALDEAGTYYVVVSNAAGSITSDTIKVEVTHVPSMPGSGGDGGTQGGDSDGGNAHHGGSGDGGPDNGYGIAAGGGGCSVGHTQNPSFGGCVVFGLLALCLLRRKRGDRRARAHRSR